MGKTGFSKGRVIRLTPRIGQVKPFVKLMDRLTDRLGKRNGGTINNGTTSFYNYPKAYLHNLNFIG